MSPVSDHKTQGLAGEEMSLVIAACHEAAFHPTASQATPTYRPGHRKQSILRKREARATTNCQAGQGQEKSTDESRFGKHSISMFASTDQAERQREPPSVHSTKQRARVPGRLRAVGITSFHSRRAQNKHKTHTAHASASTSDGALKFLFLMYRDLPNGVRHIR